MHGFPSWFAILFHPAFWWALAVLAIIAVAFLMRWIASRKR